MSAHTPTLRLTDTERRIAERAFEQGRTAQNEYALNVHRAGINQRNGDVRLPVNPYAEPNPIEAED